ncbi:MAG: GerMN domain-containing protein [Andreesenia angusta]|nr:GerMN domain-containing protein [Andreesenia angusta]
MNRKYVLGLVVLLGIFIIFKFIDNKESYQDVSENEINESLTKETNEKKDIDTQDLIIFVPDKTFTGLEERPLTLSNPDKLSTVELIIDALSENGKNKTEYNKPIPNYVKVNKAYKKNNTVFIDISSKGLQSDSARESLIIDSLILSMTTLKNVDNIQILIDGKNAQKFMGTFDISNPLGIDDVTNNIFYLDYLKKKSEGDSNQKKEEKSTDNEQKKEDDEEEIKKEEKENSEDKSEEVENTEAVEESKEEAEDDSSEELIPSEPIPMSIGNN